MTTDFDMEKHLGGIVRSCTEDIDMFRHHCLQQPYIDIINCMCMEHGDENQHQWRVHVKGHEKNPDAWRRVLKTWKENTYFKEHKGMTIVCEHASHLDVIVTFTLDKSRLRTIISSRHERES